MNTSGGGFVKILTSDTWDLKQTQEWMNEWVPTACKVTAAYLLTLYVGIKVMEKRDAFKLDVPLAIWNIALTLFSFYGAIIMLPELIWAVRNLGFVGSYCDNAEFYTDPYTGYWGWLFVISKAPEFGDSIFLILRKRPVAFLHWYHHAVTFLFLQFVYSKEQAWCRWVIAGNLVVHTLMYFYFFLRACKVYASKIIAMFITTIQISQFAIGCIMFAHLSYIKTTGSVPDCACDWNVMMLANVICISYLCLFAQFFYQRHFMTVIKIINIMKNPIMMIAKFDKDD